MTTQEYLSKLNTRFKAGNSTEHTFRGDLQNLLESILPKDVLVTNEPTRIKCGAPDYILTRNDIPLGYIEAKDLGADLGSKSYKEQFDRYRESLPNLIFTNYLDFWVYRNGEFVTKVSIGEITGKTVSMDGYDPALFTGMIQNFSSFTGTTITSSRTLAERMASEARLLATIINKALESDEENHENTTLKEQMEGFKTYLIHDITPKEFADIYAQTIAYGMFAARLHDTSLNDFSRMEAGTLIPKTNPFLRKLFQYIAGYDLDTRISWIVDALADVFRATNVAALLKNLGKGKDLNDPIIHFYETFLSEYDPVLRKSRGVWYTPEPVVNFIVRAADNILKTDFEIKQGLGDTSKVKIKVDAPKRSARSKSTTQKIEVTVHKVQILDPACGTGTFLAEIIKHLHEKFKSQQGVWSSYVENDLIPRLNGFELLMASYAMAHLNLDLLLSDTGFKPTKEQRLKVYLTNSLEEYHPDTGTLFASWLSEEANQANRVKRETPVMAVIGNPPYSISSSNRGEWILDLIKDYKTGLNERKINLDDDYIKFIRFAEHFIEKNGQGIVAMITNNSFIDGLTHRRMREKLTSTFNKIYILDLHGNANRKETTEDGQKDENVFDIQQGVSISLFVKTTKKNSNNTVFHADLYGSRDFKYDTLVKNSLTTINWTKVEPTAPNFFFTKKLFNNPEQYLTEYFSLAEAFRENNSGIQTKRDALSIHYTQDSLNAVLNDMRNLEPEAIKRKYGLDSDGRDWTVHDAKNDIRTNKGTLFEIDYRPFDTRISYFTGKTKGFIAYPRRQTTEYFLNRDNFGLVLMRQYSYNVPSFCYVIVTRNMVTDRFFISNKGTPYMFPFFIDVKEPVLFKNEQSRETNFTPTFIKTFYKEVKPNINSKRDEETFDYIYAILHSPTYRLRYEEFLKIDFPRIPYPKDQKTFLKLIKLGSELRQMHLLESPVIEEYITTYPEAGDNTVVKPKFEITNTKNSTGCVWISDTQYFDGVPKVAWEFYIGGYQPAHKWLKDRIGRTLSFDDIFHYQKIIVALTETHRLMNEIDKIKFE